MPVALPPAYREAWVTIHIIHQYLPIKLHRFYNILAHEKEIKQQIDQPGVGKSGMNGHFSLFPDRNSSSLNLAFSSTAIFFCNFAKKFLDCILYFVYSFNYERCPSAGTVTTDCL